MAKPVPTDRCRRVLITGVSRFWGGQLARRLEADPEIEQIVAVDTEGPSCELTRTDFVRADIRHSLVGNLVRVVGIDTVVHAGLIVDPHGVSRRTVHETNVIGTMNLLAACSGADSPVRHLVVKGSGLVYGSSAQDPSFWSEEMSRSNPPADAFTRDIDEVETYVRDYSLRNPETTVTMLRFASVLGRRHDTPFARLFGLPLMVPTVLGFDPRLQFIHEDDAVAALEHAVRARIAGTFNIAAPGIVILSQAVEILGKVNAPLLPFVGGSVVVGALQRLGIVDFPAEFVAQLQYGRVMETRRMVEELGFTAQHSTIETVREWARWNRARDVVEDTEYRYEGDLEEFLRRKAGSPPSCDGGASPPRRPRRAAAR